MTIRFILVVSLFVYADRASSPARRAARGGRAPAHPAQGFAPGTPDSCIRIEAVRLRGGRPGAAAPPAPPAQGCAPGNPDSMWSYATCLAHMLTGNGEQAAVTMCFAIPKACANGSIVR